MAFLLFLLAVIPPIMLVAAFDGFGRAGHE
jgi:hypothetical protein